MAELYRVLETKWDIDTVGDRYLTSVPHYFHEWFRLFGMLVLSGNFPSPSDVKASANMKVYLDVDKTAAMAGDEITYTISYRNYGSVEAKSVDIYDTLPSNLIFTSCSGSGVYDPGTRIVRWSLGTVPGFSSSAGIAPATGFLTLKVKVQNGQSNQIRNKVNIRAENGSGWSSNEFPNAVSPILKRNFVDIISVPVNGKDDTVLTELHGGRPGVRFSCLQSVSDTSTANVLKFRIFHDAQEAYIHDGVYRVSYFLYDKNNNGIAGENGANNGWKVTVMEKTGLNGVKISHQSLPEGSDEHGKWNQRIIFQFSDSNLTDTSSSNISATFLHLMYSAGIPSFVHRGVLDQPTLTVSISASDNSSVVWSDDWSWDPKAALVNTSALGFPITPDFTDPAPDNTGLAISSVHPKACENAERTIDNILVEEWDGYTWRQVFGQKVNQPVKICTAKKELSDHIMLLPVGKILNFGISKESHIQIKVLDLQGRIVSIPVNGYYKAGNHQVKLDRSGFSSKVYFIQMKTDYGTAIKKISLTK